MGQFKYETLVDFYYKCGLINHVTGRCTYSESTLVTTRNGITTSLYRPWFHLKDKGSLLFVNSVLEGEDRKVLLGIVQSFSGMAGGTTQNYLCGESSNGVGGTVEKVNMKDDSIVTFHNALAVHLMLETLAIMSKR